MRTNPTHSQHGDDPLLSFSITSAATEDGHLAGPGYAPQVFDEAAEEKLWKLSLGAVGLKDDSDQITILSV